MVQEISRMSKEMLREKLEDSDLVIIDVRKQSDWDESGFKIQGAVREQPAEEEKWSEKYSKEQTLVLYCA